MLRLYGIDPNQLEKELKASEEKISEVNEHFDSKIKPSFKIMWQEWLAEYK